MNSAAQPVERHPYLRRPHRTIFALSLPVLASLVAEPVTGLVDTAFVARLGTAPLASLGIGAGALSSIFWLFGFLGIATQTEVAQTAGRGDIGAISRSISLALLMGVSASLLLALAMLPLSAEVSRLLGADGVVLELATQYMQLRLLGAPAVIVAFVGFGALRGWQDMRTPLWIALGINFANIGLDYPLIFGWGFLPPLGVAGAALASSISQWLGALWLLWELRRRFGFSRNLDWRAGKRLLRVGRDLVIRSGALTLCLLFATRVATLMGAEAGAAHQVIRQVWFFTALLSESLASSAQSLVGYFYGSGAVAYARSVAIACTRWSLLTGVALMIAALAATPLVTRVFVPADAAAVFHLAWIVASLSQPLSALAFVTDGVHWATSDYRFLRNIMVLATICGVVGLALLPVDDSAFAGVWLMLSLWISIRAVFGLARLIPGIGDTPFKRHSDIPTVGASR